MMPPTKGGGGGMLRISSDGDGRMGAKTKPKKSPRRKLTPKQSHAKFPGVKSFQKALNEIIWKIETLEIKCCVCLFSIIPYEVITNLHIVLYTRKNTCQIFLPKQIPGIKTFKPPKNPSIIPVT